MNKSKILWLVAWLTALTVWDMLGQSHQSFLKKNKTEVSTSLSSLLTDKQVKDMEFSDIQKGFLGCINRVRIKAWLKQLKLYNSDLAQHHAQYLFESRTGDVLDPDDHYDDKGRSISERAKDEKIPIDNENCRGDCDRIWENLATSNMTIQQTVDKWLASPGHRRQIYSPSYDAIALWYYPGWNVLVADFLNLK